MTLLIFTNYTRNPVFFALSKWPQNLRKFRYIELSNYFFHRILSYFPHISF